MAAKSCTSTFGSENTKESLYFFTDFYRKKKNTFLRILRKEIFDVQCNFSILSFAFWCWTVEIQLLTTTKVTGVRVTWAQVKWSPASWEDWRRNWDTLCVGWQFDFLQNVPGGFSGWEDHLFMHVEFFGTEVEAGNVVMIVFFFYVCRGWYDLRMSIALSLVCTWISGQQFINSVIVPYL